MAIQEIVSARMNGVQVRVGRGGPGQTKYLAYRKHGGEAATRRKALRIEAIMRRESGAISRHRGMLLASNKSGLPGIRLEWREYGGDVAYLYVVGNYTDAQGDGHAFAYSVDKHGLDGALAMGLAKREAHGVPHMPLAAALSAIHAYYRAMTA